MISRIRNSRSATLVAAVLFLVGGGLAVRPPTSQVQLVAGVVFILIGILGLYNGIAGESVVETFRRS